jgi:TonB family protein
MAMNLVERPGIVQDSLNPQHRSLSAMASMTLHVAVVVLLFAVMQLRPDDASTTGGESRVPHLIWFPHTDVGGGRSGGGDRTAQPARQVQQIGRDPITVPVATPEPSTYSTSEPPEDVAAIPARPMSDGTQVLAGAIQSDNAAGSLGRGDAGAGDGPGNDRGGIGTRPGDGFGDGVRRGGPGVTMPTIIQQVSPRYTADAMRARVQGSVWIECVVLPDGSVGDTRIMRSLDPRFGLDEEALAAAKRWRFRAGQLNGQPVPVIVTIELMFSLR